MTRRVWPLPWYRRLPLVSWAEVLLLFLACGVLAGAIYCLLVTS